MYYLHSTLWTVIFLSQRHSLSAATGCNEDDSISSMTASGVLEAFKIDLQIDCKKETISVEIEYNQFSNNWFGIVFSDMMFGEALIFTKGKSGNQRTAGLYSYKTSEKVLDGVQYQESKNWDEISTTKSGSVITVSYKQDLIDTPFTIDTEMITVRAAWGQTLELEYHIGRASHSMQLNLITGSSILKKEDRTKEKVHGMLMWIAWGVMAPIAIGLSAFRWMIPECFNWYIAHRSIQIAVVTVTLIAFVIAIVFTEEKKNKHFHNAHMQLGLVVVILVILQPINAILRPHPPNPLQGWMEGQKPMSRVVWEYLHKGLGYSLWILASVAIFLGLQELGEEKLAYTHLFAWCGSICCIFAALWLWRAIKMEQRGQLDDQRPSSSEFEMSESNVR